MELQPGKLRSAFEMFAYVSCKWSHTEKDFHGHIFRIALTESKSNGCELEVSKAEQAAGVGNVV